MWRQSTRVVGLKQRCCFKMLLVRKAEGIPLVSKHPSPLRTSALLLVIAMLGFEKATQSSPQDVRVMLQNTNRENH